MAKKARNFNHITLDDEIENAERELVLRKSVYPKLIEQAKMTRDEANWWHQVQKQTVKRLKMLKSYNDAGLRTFGLFETENQAITDAAIQNNEQ